MAGRSAGAQTSTAWPVGGGRGVDGGAHRAQHGVEPVLAHDDLAAALGGPHVLEHVLLQDGVDHDHVAAPGRP